MIAQNCRVAALAAFAGMFFQFQSLGIAEMPDPSRSSAGAATTAPVWYDNFHEGWKESRRRGIPMVVFIASDHCIYCDAMKKDTWCDGAIMDQLRQSYVAIRLHRDRDSALLDRIVVPAFPTTLVASPEGKVISHRVGYQPPGEIRRLFAEALRR